MTQTLQIHNLTIGKQHPLAVMCGPCVIESEEHCLQAAAELKEIFLNSPTQLIFKSSYDKANRSSIDSFRGPGLEEGLRILQKVKETYDLPIITDVHSPEEARAAAEVADILQIPAFLCRQTDLLVAAAETGRVVSVKKGQFIAPWDMGNIVKKLESTGNRNLILTDRGTQFGYNQLVSDMRAIPIMQQHGYPVCFDASHSVQLPGGNGTHSGGQREFIPTLAKAALAAGADCLFIEAHPNPSEAKSDAASVLPFNELPALLEELSRLYEALHATVIYQR